MVPLPSRSVINGAILLVLEEEYVYAKVDWGAGTMRASKLKEGRRRNNRPSIYQGQEQELVRLR